VGDFVSLGAEIMQLIQKMSEANLLSKRVDYLKEITQTLSSLKDFTAYIAFGGVMKAGKSTCISTLVGKDILPSRTNAMTTVPTVVVHTPGQVEPVLHLSRELFDEVVKMFDYVRTKRVEGGGGGATDGSALKSLDSDTARLIFDANWTPQMTTTGTVAIHDSLYVINDLIRLHLATPLRGVLLLDEIFSSMSSFPVIAVEFTSLASKALPVEAIGRLALVDTPGEDEAVLSTELEPILQVVQRDANAYCIVMNCREPGNVAEMKLVERLLGYLGRYRYIVANMLDQTSKSIPDIKNEYSAQFAKYQSFLQGKGAEHPRMELSPDQVFPVSAYSAKVVMSFEEYLQLQAPKATLPIPSKQPSPSSAKWKLAYHCIYGQSFDEEDLEDVTVSQFRRRLKRVLDKSNMESFIQEVVVASVADASKISCISSGEKTKRLLKDLLIEQQNEQRLKELAHDKKNLEKTRLNLKEQLVKIGELRLIAKEITKRYRRSMILRWDKIVKKFETRANNYVNGTERKGKSRLTSTLQLPDRGPLFGTAQMQFESRELLSSYIEKFVRTTAEEVTDMLRAFEQKFARTFYEPMAQKMKNDLLVAVMPEVEKVKAVLSADQLVIDIPGITMPPPPHLDFSLKKGVRKKKHVVLKTVSSPPLAFLCRINLVFVCCVV